MPARMMICEYGKKSVFVRTTFGSLEFTPGEAKLVAPQLQRACRAIGITYVDTSEPTIDVPDAPEVEPQDQETRADRIRAAVLEIIERNDVDEFTAGGTPKIKAISGVAKLTKVGLNEVEPILQELNEEREAARSAQERAKLNKKKDTPTIKDNIDESGAEDC